MPGCRIEVLAQPGADQRTYKPISQVCRDFPGPRVSIDRPNGAQELYAAVQGPPPDARHLRDERFIRLKWLRHLLDTGRLDAALRWDGLAANVDPRRRGAKPMIDGVKIIPLRQIVDERGKIMHMMKATDPHFIRFGEIYFSCAWPGTIKAWHIHQTMTVNNAVLRAAPS